MDRAVLEGDPHAVLEGMLIGGYAMGAGEAYMYVRAEYPLAIERLKTAIEQMEEYGLLGDDILDSGFSFRVKIKEGAGAFVCGEETALMASIEGDRGMPRPRPPFPASSGLWGKPTTINNVETWADVSAIFQKGADWYAGHGTDRSRGTKTFSLVGKVNRTGLIEVPMGIPLRRLSTVSAAGSRTTRDSRLFRPAVLRAGACPPVTSIRRSIMKRWQLPVPSWGRAAWWSWTRIPAWWTWPGTS